MDLKHILDAMNAMETDGIIGRCTMAGGLAACRYIQARNIDLVEILVEAGDLPKINTTGPWAVRMTHAVDTFDLEALNEADTVEFSYRGSEVRSRVLRPEHLAALMAGTQLNNAATHSQEVAPLGRRSGQSRAGQGAHGKPR